MEGRCFLATPMRGTLPRRPRRIGAGKCVASHPPGSPPVTNAFQRLSASQEDTLPYSLGDECLGNHLPATKIPALEQSPGVEAFRIQRPNLFGLHELTYSTRCTMASKPPG